MTSNESKAEEGATPYTLHPEPGGLRRDAQPVRDVALRPRRLVSRRRRDARDHGRDVSTPAGAVSARDLSRARQWLKLQTRAVLRFLRVVHLGRFTCHAISGRGD